jgi:uncharacterized protein YabN with tetrapyrrole methylase and pyrophosphatase domain
VLETADDVRYLVADPLTRAWLERLRPDARSLLHHYKKGRRRRDVYEAITVEIVGAVRGGGAVCAAFYGHPGIFVDPSHEAMRRVRAEGLPARMLPAVSAEDCLLADLGIDPASRGLQSYEATDFLLYGREIDASAALILWQVGVVAQWHVTGGTGIDGLRLLAEHLQKRYPADHEVTLYEASPFPVCGPLVETTPLSALGDVEPPALATLYVPPAERRTPDLAMLERLRMVSRNA